MAPRRCEWCKGLLSETYWTSKDDKGTAHGYFCGPKCLNEASKEGFRGSGHAGCGQQIGGFIFFAFIVLAVYACADPRRKALQESGNNPSQVPVISKPPSQSSFIQG